MCFGAKKRAANVCTYQQRPRFDSHGIWPCPGEGVLSAERRKGCFEMQCLHATIGISLRAGNRMHRAWLQDITRGHATCAVQACNAAALERVPGTSTSSCWPNVSCLIPKTLLMASFFRLGFSPTAGSSPSLSTCPVSRLTRFSVRAEYN
jgi:hypothetical protein